MNKKSGGLTKGNIIETGNKRYAGIIVFALFFLLKCTMLLRDKVMDLSSDHLGDLATPSYLGGRNWLPMISETSYYGYGFKWIYFIFFKLTDRAETITRAIQFTQIFMIALCAAVLYMTVIKYWYDGKHSIQVFGILAVGNAFASVTYNSEGSLYFFTLLIAAVLIKLAYVQDRKQKISWSITLAVLLCYMMTLHERCIGLLLAVFIVLICDWIYSRKCYVHPVSFGCSFVVLYILQELLTNRVVQFFWGNSAGEGTLKNTSVSVSNPTWFLESIGDFNLFIKFCISNLFTLICSTYGLVLIPIIITVYCFVRFIFKNKSFKDEYKGNRAMLIVMLIFLATSVIILVGVAQRWGLSVHKENKNGYKGMVYPRYYMPFIWGSLVAGCTFFEKSKEKLGKICLLITLAVYGLMTLEFRVKILPMITGHISLTFQKRFCSFMSFFPNQYLTTAFMFSIVASLTIFLVYWYTIKSEKRWILVVGILFVFFFEYSWSSTALPKLDTGFDTARDFYREYAQIEQGNKDIYYATYALSDTDRNPYTFQYVLNTATVYKGWPEGEGLIVSETPLDELTSNEKIATNIILDQVACLDIGEGLYVYAQGNELIGRMIEAGMEFERCEGLEYVDLPSDDE